MISDFRFRISDFRFGRTRWRGRVVLVGLLILLGPVLCGCGGGGLDRLPVAGSVTLDGNPLADGSITFIPTGEGVTAGGKIADGQYEIPRSDGPVPGSHQVRINASEPTGETIIDPAGDIEVPQMRSLIPPKYNVQSELTAEVTADGPNRFDFELSSQ